MKRSAQQRTTTKAKRAGNGATAGNPPMRRPRGSMTNAQPPIGVRLGDAAYARLGVLCAARGGWTYGRMIEHLILSAPLTEHGTPTALAEEVAAMMATRDPETIAQAIWAAKRQAMGDHPGLAPMVESAVREGVTTAHETGESAPTNGRRS